MKITLYFIISLVIVLFTSYYQRVTGPTYEKEAIATLNNIAYELKLQRSHEIGEPCLLKLNISDTTIKAIVNYKRYPTNDNYVAQAFDRQGDELIAELPQQPAAGKLHYFITFFPSNEKTHLIQREAVIIRFKGAVPAGILVTHIIFIFMGMWFSNLTAILAIVKHNKQKLFAMVSTSLSQRPDGCLI